jgi:hypothetical protein
VFVEGHSAASKSGNRRKDPFKTVKPIDRVISTPNIAGGQLLELPRAVSMTGEFDRPLSNDIQTADDALSPDLQQYFAMIVNLLRFDTVHTFTRMLARVAKEDKIHDVVPYVLQFVFGKFALELQNPRIVIMMIELTLAIVSNPFLNVLLFMHPLLKIAFTGLLAVSIGNDGLDDDKPIRIRSAALLKILCDHGQVAFPSMCTVVTNQLIATLFDPTLSLRTHLGAIAGIRELGSIAVAAVMPHIPMYIAAVRYELESANPDHRMLVPIVVQELIEIVEFAGNPPGVAERIAALADDSNTIF